MGHLENFTAKSGTPGGIENNILIATNNPTQDSSSSNTRATKQNNTTQTHLVHLLESERDLPEAGHELVQPLPPEFFMVPGTDQQKSHTHTHTSATQIPTACMYTSMHKSHTHTHQCTQIPTARMYTCKHKSHKYQQHACIRARIRARKRAWIREYTHEYRRRYTNITESSVEVTTVKGTLPQTLVEEDRSLFSRQDLLLRRHFISHTIPQERKKYYPVYIYSYMYKVYTTQKKGATQKNRRQKKRYHTTQQPFRTHSRASFLATVASSSSCTLTWYSSSLLR